MPLIQHFYTCCDFVLEQAIYQLYLPLLPLVSSKCKHNTRVVSKIRGGFVYPGKRCSTLLPGNSWRHQTIVNDNISCLCCAVVNNLVLACRLWYTNASGILYILELYNQQPYSHCYVRAFLWCLRHKNNDLALHGKRPTIMHGHNAFFNFPRPLAIQQVLWEFKGHQLCMEGRAWGQG